MKMNIFDTVLGRLKDQPSAAGRRAVLGIHLSRRSVTVVYLVGGVGDLRPEGCFTVTAEHSDAPALNPGDLVADGCEERHWRFLEAAVSLDCSMYTQHHIASEFTDIRQVAATIRFDAEEAIAGDVSRKAVAFRTVSPGDGSPSEVALFTADRKDLSDILSSLQGRGIDPVTIQPDIQSLVAFVSSRTDSGRRGCRLFAVFSRMNCYLIAFSESGEPSVMRSFVAGDGDHAEVLVREVPITAAVAGVESFACVEVLGLADSIDPGKLASRLGTEVETSDLVADRTGQVDQPVAEAMAQAAASSCLEKTQTANFRDDFAPYQGGKIRLQNTLKILSASATVLMVALGIYMQLQLFKQNNYRNRLHKKFQPQYSAVMLQKKNPETFREASRLLEQQLRRIRELASGRLSVTGGQSVSAKLTLLLEAFNGLGREVDLDIETISISDKIVSVAGSTSNRRNTLALFSRIKQAKLDIQQQRLYAKGTRDSFHITISTDNG